MGDDKHGCPGRACPQVAQVLSVPVLVNGKAHTVPRVMFVLSQLPAGPVRDVGTLRALSADWPPGRDTETAHDTWLGGTKLI